MSRVQMLERYAASCRDGSPRYSLFEVQELLSQGGGLFALTDLRGINLAGLNLTHFDLRWANLRGANLQGVMLASSTVINANLTFANLKGAILQGTNLNKANLQGANLQDATLTFANLRRVNATCADFTGASFYGADLAGTDFTGATLTRTDLDPSNKPSGLPDSHFFESDPDDPDYVIGFRTRRSHYVGDTVYEPYQSYEAPWFSTGDTDCHPGLYLAPNITSVRLSTHHDVEIVRVRAKRDEIHKTCRPTTKYRVRRFTVLP